MTIASRAAIFTSALLIAGAAHAAPVRIDGLGDSTILNAGQFSGVGLSTADSAVLRNNPLRGIHAQLQADGIDTNGVVTLLAAEVDSTGDGLNDSLGFFALVDEETESGKFRGFNARLGFMSWVDGDADFLVNDPGEKLGIRGGDDPLALGRFDWDKREKGDAFGWTDLEVGESGDMHFWQAGHRAGIEGFQFLTWTAEGWDVALTGDFNPGGYCQPDHFGFQFAIVPIPGAVWMGFAGLAAVGAARRRMA
ncbi:MAG: hypothetical protein AB8G96_09670 [Phycisphaerales bacterium]